MIEEKKNVLIISYIFPPAPGIGGRRWAKFAKYLRKKSIDVYVISAEVVDDAISTWISDVEGIEVIRLNSKYPKIISTNPKSLIEKILYRIKLLEVKCRIKGNYFDKAAFIEKNLKESVLKVVKEKKIKNIIVSGFPFYLNYFICKLKPDLSGVKIISDFRDPWTWKNSYSLDKMSIDRQNEEKKKEAFVVEKSDLITMPSNIMVEEISLLYPKYKDKFIELPHGYDIEESCFKTENKNLGVVKFIMFGTMYITIENEISNLAEVLKNNINTSRLDVYCFSPKYTSIFEEHNVLNENVFYHNPLTENELYKKLIETNYYILVCPDHAKDYFFTKIFEIIYCRIPIIYIGAKGTISIFLEKNNLGIIIEKDQIQNEFQKILNGEIGLNYNYNFDASHYSMRAITEKLITHLI
jgi:hypothetical protein